MPQRKRAAEPADAAGTAAAAGTADAAGTAHAAEPQGAGVRPLERGLAVLRVLSGPGRERVRPVDLVHVTGLPRATVDRVVATLDHLGYVRFDGQEVALAPAVLELGNAYLTACGLPDALSAGAAQLADELDESVSLAVPDGDGIRFIHQTTRRRTMALAFRIGDLLPAERCAPGALFAAGWPEDAWQRWRERHAADPHNADFDALPPCRAPESEQGFRARAAAAQASDWALDDQLIEPGLIAVSVPVHRPDGSLGCALSVVSHTSRHDARGLADAVLPRLRTAASRMEAALGTPPAAITGTADDPDGLSGLNGPDGSGSGQLRRAREELGSGYLQSLARGLAVLRALGRARGAGLPLTALSDATGLARATARRLLIALERMGYAESTGRLFRPVPRVLELGCARLSRLSFAELTQPHLQRLVDRVGESASVTVLDGEDIRYLARLESSRVMSVSIAPGTRFPAHATAMGRVLLAGLAPEERMASLKRAAPRAYTARTVTSLPELAALVEQAAREGSSLVDDELEDGLRSVAVPLRSADGRTVAAINIALHSGTCPAGESRRDLVPLLRETAAAIEADLHTVTRHQPLQIS